MLAAISQRIRGKIIGDRTLNGKLVSENEMLNISSFLSQIDIAVKSLTAYEHLYFMVISLRIYL